MRFVVGVILSLVLTAATGEVRGDDPRGERHGFAPTLHPPGGFSVKRGTPTLRPSASNDGSKTIRLLDDDGKFIPAAQWYYDLGSDPRNFDLWWRTYFSDASNWPTARTPVWKGTVARNEGYRILGFLGKFRRMIERDSKIDPAVKRSLCNARWRAAVEKAIAATIDERGWLGANGNQADLDSLSHFVAITWRSVGLSVDQIYTIDRAQDLVCTLLTDPSILRPDDAYLACPDKDYLEARRGDADLQWKGDEILYTGGMFISGKDTPSLHGTWCGLALLNALFDLYPESNPSSPQSIFYKWNRLPDEKKRIAKTAFTTMSNRLWLAWKDHGGPCWCWIADGKPTRDTSRPSEAPTRPAWDGYGRDQYGWASMCWSEMFGAPALHGSDGVKALLAICRGPTPTAKTKKPETKTANTNAATKSEPSGNE